MTALPVGRSTAARLPAAVQADALPTASPAPRTLGELRRGERAIICGLDESCAADVRHRLRQLGFSEGREVELVRRAPLGCPVVVRVCDAQICLRRAQIDAISIDTADASAAPAHAA